MKVRCLFFFAVIASCKLLSTNFSCGAVWLLTPRRPPERSRFSGGGKDLALDRLGALAELQRYPNFSNKELPVNQTYNYHDLAC